MRAWLAFGVLAAQVTVQVPDPREGVSRRAGDANYGEPVPVDLASIAYSEGSYQRQHVRTRGRLSVLEPNRYFQLADGHARVALPLRVQNRRHAEQARQPVALTADALVAAVVPAVPLVVFGHGVGPVAAGRDGSDDQWLHDPSYSRPPSRPASSSASRSCVALRLDPQYATTGRSFAPSEA